jgi:hypothetical protein
MKLPNALSAVVEREKITEYLLNPAHPDNGGKAPFFIALGFERENWEAFADALRRLASNGRVSKYMETAHGKKYIVDGTLESPTGKIPLVRTVWIINKDAEVARLVTAYPHERSDND